MKKIDGAELLGVLIRKLTQNWEGLCSTYITDDVIPAFTILPMHQYVLTVVEKHLTNDYSSADTCHAALQLTATKLDSDILLNRIVHEDVMPGYDPDGDDTDFIYNEFLCITAEQLTQLMVDIKDTNLLFEYLSMQQKLAMGRFLYFRNIYNDCESESDYYDLRVREAMKLNTQFCMLHGRYNPIEERRHFYTDIDENKGMLEAVGITVDELLDLEQRVDKVIADTRQFTITEELYN